MSCMKCGRDTTEEHIFCDVCRENMKQHPVDPTTAIHLPTRSTVYKRTARKRGVPLEEQIQTLRRSLRRTRAFAVILLVVLALTAAALVHVISRLDEPLIGQNYTITLGRSTD